VWERFDTSTVLDRIWKAMTKKVVNYAYDAKFEVSSSNVS